MNKIFWLVVGVGLGFVAAHFANRTPAGQRFFAQIDRGTREFTDAVARGYRSREAEFASTIDDVEQAIKHLKNS